MANVSLDGAIHFVCVDWWHMDELRAAGDSIYSELKNLIVWAKTNGGMGTFYLSRHELIFVCKVGIAKHLKVLSDECELVSARTVALTFILGKDSAIW